MRNVVRHFWVWLTYFKVACDYCNGTGICQTGTKPHSCCGECDRLNVDASTVPLNFSGVARGRAMIGDGVMWRRPWSRAQVKLPSWYRFKERKDHR